MAKLRGLSIRIAAFFRRGTESETVGALLNRVAASAIIAAAVLPVTAIVSYGMGLTPGEFPLFGPAGANFLTAHWNLVFVNAKTQAGPFEILPYGIAQLLHLHLRWQWFTFYLCMNYLFSFILSLVMFLPIRRVSGRWGRYVPLFVLAVALIGAFLPTAIVRAHLAEVMIPLLWIVAGCLARERFFAAAGVVIALSAGFEVWGVLGVPVLFLAVSPKIVRAAVGAIITVAVIYLPFVLTGTFRMFEFHWEVSLGTIYRFFFPYLSTFPWTFRLVQAVLALAAGWGVALAVRKLGNYGVWLVPMAILTVRLVFDPLLYFYYWMGPATVALCALAAGIYLRRWIQAIVAAVVIAWLWFPPQRSVPTAVGTAALTGLCVLAIWIAHRRGRLTEAGEAGEPGEPAVSIPRRDVPLRTRDRTAS